MESSAFPEGCVALVTGGSRGIGLATAERLARAGVRTVLVSRTGSACEREAARLSAEHGVECAGIACDVRIPGEVVAAIRDVHASFRRLDVLINNAGILADALLGMASPDLVRDAFETNSIGAAQVLQAASRLLLRSPAGAVVNVTSIVGADGNAGQAVYAASKAALVGLTRAAARELGPGGVRVNAVAPGLIETDMTAALPPEARRALEERILLGRPGAPQDVAAVIAFLVSNEARYVTGQVLRVDGGLVV
jgi:3-oxoacyl-[acyl-carrier protein] reductase